MLTRRHSIVFAVLAFCGGLLLWSWDDLLSDLLTTHGSLRIILGGFEFLLLGPGMAVMAYAVSENARHARVAIAHERELARSQRLMALGRVAAGLAHEVRNPLHNIRLLIEESRASADPAEREEMLARVDGNLDRIDRAVELVYRLARPQRVAADGGGCDLAVCATQAVEGERRRVAGKTEILLGGVQPAPSAGEPDDVGIALDNLLRNATAAADGEPVRVALLRLPGAWRITVRNRGRLAAAVLAAGQGDGFASAKPGGLGLGLSIARQLMVEAGGSLELVQDGDMVEARITLPEASAT